MKDSLAFATQNTEGLSEWLNYLAIFISISGLIISLGVFVIHFRRDRRESKNLAIEKKRAQKKVKISTSKVNYNFDQGIVPETNDYYEDHIVTFDYTFRNNGNPMIYPESVLISFLKPLLGEEIKEFRFNVNPSKMKIEKGDQITLRFAQSFDSVEIADSILKSSVKIRLVDIEGDRFETPLFALISEEY
ncbi:hypothetical protein [Algoriphagus aquimarinus]|uniref:hypothetical protein n=1 Tax=Algoriphagus aquimarinus TaxID=237018 RepID=UPI0030DAFF3F